MNIEEIRRRVREREGIKVPFEKPAEVILKKEDSDDEEKPTQKISRNIHTEIFDLDKSSDEEIEPQSMVWVCGSEAAHTFGTNVNEFIGDCDLLNPAYDWREKTKKGRKSRQNFSNYIVNLSYS